MPSTNAIYRGRFAPSPTGPLHLGSLIAALASYLDARHHNGQWLVRMEDLDPPREETGAAQRILNSLQRHCLQWDEDVLWQSKRSEAYETALHTLAINQHLFACDCTRALLGPNGACAGRCGHRAKELSSPSALRARVPAQCHIRFYDGIQGDQSEALGETLQDSLVRRKDGLYAYQLAVVVDDAAQGITHIVRGSDLLDSTARQICLQQQLDLTTPEYSHLPVITTRAGQKFSKQNQAPALDDDRAGCNLRLALRFLGQQLPPARLSPQEILTFAIGRWQRNKIPAAMAVPAKHIGLKS
ncbi:MAG: glutamyl-Q tRNA(Asp) synthetase [Bacteroidia bacterium]